MNMQNAEEKEKWCIIDIGGGLRGMYAAGVLDRLLDLGVDAHLCIGVSAGSANLSTYIARQKGRCYAYYHDYSFRPEYFSLRNFFRIGSAFDFDYIYSTLSNSDGEYPIDYPVFSSSSTQMITVATNALTGKPAYFDSKWMRQDHYDVLKGSCAIPYLCHPWKIANLPYCDGTCSDPIPIQKALDLGADKILILFPRDPVKDKSSRAADSMMRVLGRSHYGRHYPAVVRALEKRDQVSRDSLAKALALQKKGKAFVLSPKNLHHVSSLSATPEHLDGLYQEGYGDGDRAAAFFRGCSAGKELIYE